MKIVMIANRGEIAVRILRACQELGLQTVAVYSTEDRESLHVKLADRAICIGPGPSAASYLSIPALLSAASITGVDAIHPGYGFLSESDTFAEACQQHGITFIGPSAASIRMLGNKIAARQLAKTAQVPLFPGSQGAVKDLEEAMALADAIGFPLIVKAAAGGGGRGMKIVHNRTDLEKQFHLARSEAAASFGNPEVFIERYLEKARHIEIQVLGDTYGHLIHLGERDCSMQRRYQKVIEESPCLALDVSTREALGSTAVRLAKLGQYHSAGTVEFLLDQKQFYFMEMNTRIQVEHPVTEEVTGIDLVKEQIRIAQGLRLSLQQSDIVTHGHSIECRINAEDPVSFLPWPGLITGYHAPGGPGIRVDSMVYSGYRVSSLYDSMIAKLIAHGRDRREALDRMRRALQEMKVEGIRTNIAFHLRVLASEAFQKGDISTTFIENFKD